MSIQDKVSGRLKQAAGDLTGDQNLHRQGVRDERKAEAKAELREAEQRAQRLREEIARLEYESPSEETSQPTAREGSPSHEQVRDAQTREQRSANDAAQIPRDEPS